MIFPVLFTAGMALAGFPDNFIPVVGATAGLSRIHYVLYYNMTHYRRICHCRAGDWRA